MASTLPLMTIGDWFVETRFMFGTVSGSKHFENRYDGAPDFHHEMISSVKADPETNTFNSGIMNRTNDDASVFRKR